MKLLKKGDTIGLAAPARYIEPKELSLFIKWLEYKQLKVKLSENIFHKFHQFAGDKNFRRDCFQNLLEDNSLNAIWIVRGGYGTTQILGELDWSNFVKNPKWVIGFSDITLLHLKLASLGIPSIHGDMPSRFGKVNIENFESIYQILTYGKYEYTVEIANCEEINLSGKIVGGNLSLLCHAIGNPNISFVQNCLLFLEDLEEYYYHVDRMAYQMYYHGIFNHIKGLLLGSFSDMRDNDVPFGFSVKAIFQDKTIKPIITHLPFGHSYNNFAFIHAQNICISIQNKIMRIQQNYYG